MPLKKQKMKHRALPRLTCMTCMTKVVSQLQFVVSTGRNICIATKTAYLTGIRTYTGTQGSTHACGWCQIRLLCASVQGMFASSDCVLRTYYEPIQAVHTRIPHLICFMFYAALRHSLFWPVCALCYGPRPLAQASGETQRLSCVPTPDQLSTTTTRPCLR